MKIVLIGASGYVGSAILAEALNRGHYITAIVRHPEKLAKQDRLTSHGLDILEPAKLAPLMANHHAVISAFNAFNQDVSDSTAVKHQVDGTLSIMNAMKLAQLNRLLVVGGAGSLEVAAGLQLVDTPAFPTEYKSMAVAMREVLRLLKTESALDWTFLSPSALLQPGERTGKFRLGQDQLLMNENGQSIISTQDYAVAMIDELENPKHHQQRFTVGY